MNTLPIAPPLWHTDLNGTFPSRHNAEADAWHLRYLAALRDHFGSDIKPALAPVATTIPGNLIYRPDRRDLYQRMLVAGDKLPPVFVDRAPNGAWRMIDGSHRLDAARRYGKVLHLEAFTFLRTDLDLPDPLASVDVAPPGPVEDPHRFMRDASGRCPWEAGFDDATRGDWVRKAGTINETLSGIVGREHR